MRDSDDSTPRRHFLLAIVAFAALMAGCDLTGQYDKELQKSFQSAGQRAVFDLNLHAAFTEVVDASRQNVGVKLRLPKVFDGETKTQAAGAQSPLPGAYVMMRQLDDESGKFLPVTITFAVMPKGDQKFEAIQNGISTGMAAMMPGIKWTDASVATPSGQTTTFKRLQFEGADPQKAKVNLPPLDFYLIDAGANVVLVGWMAPKPQAQKYNLVQAIEAAMGTVEVTAPPAAPAGKAAPGKAAAAPAGKAAPGCF